MIEERQASRRREDCKKRKKKSGDKGWGNQRRKVSVKSERMLLGDCGSTSVWPSLSSQRSAGSVPTKYRVESRDPEGKRKFCRDVQGLLPALRIKFASIYV